MRKLQATDQTTPDLWDPQILQWRILQYLQNTDDSALQQYLGQNRNSAKTWQLANSLAEAFDRYRLYRSEDLRAWLSSDSSSSQSWQLPLLQALAKEQHPIDQQDELETYFRECPIESLPPRVVIFGMSSIAPNYLRLLHTLAQRISVSLYSLSPSPLYFADIRSNQFLARLSDLGKTPAQDHYDVGNSLLAQCGKSACEFQIMLESADCHIHAMDWSEPTDANLLQRIKHDVYQVQEPGTDDIPTHELNPDDRSIQIHNCHSPLRELETLRDFLLRSFHHNAELTSDDIIVMSPQPDVYAPYIDAVFNYMDDGNQLPISFGDRHYNEQQHAHAAFLTTWDMLHGRFEHRAVLDLLNLPAIQERWQWSHDQCQQLTRIVESTGVIWGSDEQHRQSVSGTSAYSGTWLEGLHRCLLGYMHGNAQDQLLTSRGISPLENIESYDSELVLDFTLFIQKLRTLRKLFQKQHTAKDWTQLLNQLLSLTCPENETFASVTQHMRQRIDQTLSAIERSAPDTSISSQVLHQSLKQQLDSTDDAHGFFDGRITFCGLKPMRSIPFKIICLLGMNEHEFPRHSKRWDFDLLHDDDKRYGDRDLANEDRLLFLETLLSCQDTYYISYCGQHIRTQQEQSAAAIVEEFIDYCAMSTALKREELLKRISYKHHLHPSNPLYLDPDSWVRCMSQHFYPEQTHTNTDQFQFITTTAETKANSEISLAQFQRFWDNPMRYFLAQQYQVQPYSAREQRLADHEFQHDGLNKHQLRDVLINHPECTNAAYWQAQHQVPPGIFGSVLFDQDMDIINQCKALSSTVTQHAEISVACNGLNILAADLPFDAQDQLIMVIPHTKKPKRLFQAWLSHLLANVDHARTSKLGILNEGQLQVLEFAPEKHALDLLKPLVDAYLIGQQKPIMYFPETAHAYAEALQKGKPEAVAL